MFLYALIYDEQQYHNIKGERLIINTKQRQKLDHIMAESINNAQYFNK